MERIIWVVVFAVVYFPVRAIIDRVFKIKR